MANDLSRILELDRVLDLLASHCVYSVARERAATIGPSSDPNQVAYLLSITREAVDLLSTNPGFSVGGVRDIRPVLEAELAWTVGPRGEILDTASPELAEIRRGLKSAHARLLDRLNRMIAS